MVRVAQRLGLLALLLLLAGCAAQRRAHLDLVVPHSCIVSIEMTEQTECRGPADGSEPLRCTNITLKKEAGCEYTEVQRAKPRAPNHVPVLKGKLSK